MMPLSTIVLLFGVVCSAVSNLVPFSTSNDGELSIMTLTDNGEVIVAGQNAVFRLSANLSMLDNVTTSGTVRGLSLTNGGQYVMICVDTDRSCSVYNVTDFNDTLSGVMLLDSAESDDDPVAMFPGEAEGDVYVGTAAVTDRAYPMFLGQYSITGESIVTDRTREYFIVGNLLNERIFHTGFVLDDYTYYIVGDRENDIRILRVCNQSTNQTIDNEDTMFRALYEVQLTCGRSAVFAGASVVQDYPNPGNDTVVLVVRPQDDVSSGNSRVCTYNIFDINTAMDNTLTACAAGTASGGVWSNSFLNSDQQMNLCAQPSVS